MSNGTMMIIKIIHHNNTNICKAQDVIRQTDWSHRSQIDSVCKVLMDYVKGQVLKRH